MEDLIPTGMTDTAMLAVIVGFFSPLVLNFLVSVAWRQWVKALVAFIFSAIVGTITALLTGSYEGLGVPSTILLTLVVAITSYENFWKPVTPNMQAKVGVGAGDVVTVQESAATKPQVSPDRPSIGALATRVVPVGQLPLAASIGTETPLTR